LASAGKFFLPEDSSTGKLLAFVGDPGIAMLIAVLTAIPALGLRGGMDTKTIGRHLEQSVGSIAMILLIIGGGGAFKQVLTDSGVGAEIADLFKTSSLSPLFLGWLIA